MVNGIKWFYSRHGVAIMLLLGLAAATAGCTGKKVPSYKDRIGTIDPATAPLGDDPPPPE
jgi:3-deoxy-D-manno-octulosonate 8-phosphate phosphatase KdsC-like HAD superfamily phosphatase